MAATRQKLFKIFQDPPSPTPKSKSKPKPCLQPSALPLEPISKTSIKHNVKIKTPRKIGSYRSPSKRYQCPSPTPAAAGFGDLALPPPNCENAFTDCLQKDGQPQKHPTSGSDYRVQQPAPAARPQFSRPVSQPLPPQLIIYPEFQSRPASAFGQGFPSEVARPQSSSQHLSHFQSYNRPFTPTELGDAHLPRSGSPYSHAPANAYSPQVHSYAEHAFSPVHASQGPTSGQAINSPEVQLNSGFSPVQEPQPNQSQQYSPIHQSPQSVSAQGAFQPVSNALNGDFPSNSHSSHPTKPYAAPNFVPANTYPQNYAPSTFDSAMPVGVSGYTHMQYVPNLQPTMPQQALFTTFHSVPSDTHKTLQRPGQSDNFASFPSPSHKKTLKRSASYAFSPKKGRTQTVDTLPDPADMPEIEDDGEKPGYSYAGLIAHAILRAPDRRLTLAQIYKWISDSFDFYKTAGIGWQNSIRHNLSLNKAFQKQERPKNDSGKGNYWTIVSGMEMQFIKEKPTRKGTSIAQLAAPPQRKPTPAPLSSALAPQQWAPLPVSVPITRELSSDATIALSDDEGDIVAINSSPPMPAPARPLNRLRHVSPSPAPCRRSPSPRKRKSDMDDSGYFSSLESSILRPRKVARVEVPEIEVRTIERTIDGTIKARTRDGIRAASRDGSWNEPTRVVELPPVPSALPLDRKGKGRAEEEIARIRSDSRSDPIRPISVSSDLPDELSEIDRPEPEPVSTPSIIHRRHIGSELMTPSLSRSRKLSTPVAARSCRWGAPALSPTECLRRHRAQVALLQSSPEQADLSDPLPYSPLFHLPRSKIDYVNLVTPSIHAYFSPIKSAGSTMTPKPRLRELWMERVMRQTNGIPSPLNGPRLQPSHSDGSSLSPIRAYVDRLLHTTTPKTDPAKDSIDWKEWLKTPRVVEEGDEVDSHGLEHYQVDGRRPTTSPTHLFREVVRSPDSERF